jgi:hypothetical protein
VRHREVAEGTRALGVHAPLGDHLAVEVSQLLQQPDVLQQRRAARASGLRVGVVDYGRPVDMSELLHLASLEVVRVAENINAILGSAAHVHSATKVGFVLYLWDYEDYVPMRSPQLGLLSARGDDGRALLVALELATGGVSEFDKGVRTEVGQRVSLQTGPQVLHRLEVQRVAGQQRRLYGALGTVQIRAHDAALVLDGAVQTIFWLLIAPSWSRNAKFVRVMPAITETCFQLKWNWMCGVRPLGAQVVAPRRMMHVDGVRVRCRWRAHVRTRETDCGK